MKIPKIEIITSVKQCSNVPIIQISFLILGTIGLKDLKVTVPSVVQSGDSVTLTCNFDLEGKVLYTVKWYLDEAEFYRFTPKREPPGLVLTVRNLKINVSYYIFIPDSEDSQ